MELQRWPARSGGPLKKVVPIDLAEVIRYEVEVPDRSTSSARLPKGLGHGGQRSTRDEARERW